MSSSTAEPAPVKVLTLGPCLGAIKELFAKITSIDAKYGKFDFALCVGNFFGPPTHAADEREAQKDLLDLLEGKVEVPLECYLMQGDQPLPEVVLEKFRKTSGELCKNLFLLTKSGLVTTAHGMRIACLGGVYDPHVYASSEVAPGFSSPFFAAQTVERLISNTLTKPQAKSQNYNSLSAIFSSIEKSQPVDVLITNSWPSVITEFSSVPLPLPDFTPDGAPPVDDVVKRIKPRYHFAVGGGGQPPLFWERAPFVWDDEAGRVTRFVSLGAFGGESSPGRKQRWFYAFSITPNAQNPPRPNNATKNPFVTLESRPSKRPTGAGGAENFIFGEVEHPNKRNRVSKGVSTHPPEGYQCKRCGGTEHFINDCPERAKPPEGYVCKICDVPGHFVRDCPTRHAVGDTGGRKPKEGYVCRACGSEAHYLDDCHLMRDNSRTSGRGGKREPPKEIGPDECWFCLSNPNLAKHLIVSIGTECYLALPKGQIIPTQSSAGHINVPGGGHVLIVPITHYPTLASIPPDLSPPILEEVERYKVALRAFFAKHGCAGVFFEVGRLSAKGGHAHVQAVPVPRRLQNRVEEAFVREGRALGVEFEPDTGAPLDSQLSYFRVDLPDGKRMVHLMRDRVPFSIQFGRQVMVSVLNMPDRLDWKACMLSEEDDKVDAQTFKEAFAPFDPST